MQANSEANWGLLRLSIMNGFVISKVAVNAV